MKRMKSPVCCGKPAEFKVVYYLNSNMHSKLRFYFQCKKCGDVIIE